MSAILTAAPAAHAAGAAPDGCPECGAELEDRGPFDGTEASPGVTGGHEGFGGTLMCAAGHWYASIQGALVPPQHILTVLEPEGQR